MLTSSQGQQGWSPGIKSPQNLCQQKIRNWPILPDITAGLGLESDTFEQADQAWPKKIDGDGNWKM